MTFYGIVVVGGCFVAALWANGKMIWRSTRLCQTERQAQEAVELLNREHAARHSLHVAGK